MQAIQIMSALAQDTRLKVYQLLVERLPAGMTAGEIADSVKMSRNGMSPHFAILSAAGLVSAVKEGRQVIYKAEIKAVEELAAFLGKAVQRAHEETLDSLDW